MNKYRNVPVTVDGIRFDSKKEAVRYGELKLLEKAGEVWCLNLQPRYPIEINGVKICTYVADFNYIQAHKFIVEDVKGVKTPVYKLKKKLVEAVHGIEIREV